jgi:NADPH:quinone reductase-like Zn-dependent oxidoreductase
MKAWRFAEFGGAEKLELQEIDSMEPGSGEVSVKVAYAGVNHVDRLVIGGRLRWIDMPHIPGAEYVGTVLDVGKDVKGIDSGDRVAIHPKIFCGECRYCRSGEEGVCLMSWNPSQAPVDLSTYMLPAARNGGWAEEALIYARNIVKLPDSIHFKDAASLPLSAMTANHMIRRVSPKSGEEALVMGAAGSVGMYAMQLLRERGCAVTAVVRHEPQARVIEKYCDSVILFQEAFKSIAEKSRSGKGFDIVIDPLGQATFDFSSSALSPCGRYVTCGTLTGASATLDLMALYSRERSFIGSTTGSPQDLKEVIQLMDEGRIEAIPSTVFEFKQAREAIAELQRAGRIGKVLLRVNASS